MRRNEMDIEEARKKIGNEVEWINIRPYSHNIIGMVLSSVCGEHGKEKANDLIDEFKLEKLGWKKLV